MHTTTRIPKKLYIGNSTEGLVTKPLFYTSPPQAVGLLLQRISVLLTQGGDYTQLIYGASLVYPACHCQRSASKLPEKQSLGSRRAHTYLFLALECEAVGLRRLWPKPLPWIAYRN
jgi:hypothetical protein